MEHLSALFLRVLTVSAGCSLVLAPLLLLCRRLRKKIAAKSFYVLFLLLALRLVLPVELRLPVPAVELHAPDLTVSVPAAPVSTQSPAVRPDLVPVQAAPQPVKQVPVRHILGAIWAVGALCCAAFAAGGYALARRKLLSGSEAAGGDESALLERLRQELGVRRPVSLRRSESAPGPLALGLLRPVIVLPGKPAEELVLRHELTHIRRWDVAYKLVLSLACWVNWFNPFVWLMDRAAGRNLELCCDDEVTRDLSEGERRRYGSLLLDAAAARSIPFSTCFSGGKTQMKERLLNLFTRKRNSAALVGLVLIAALLAGGLVAGGLVACEQADTGTPTGNPDTEPLNAGAAPAPVGSPAAQLPTSSPENEARRALLKDYFYANYTEDNASVVLADLTGDGLDEMLVLTLRNSGDGTQLLPPGGSMDSFGYGEVETLFVRDGKVEQATVILDVASAHAGWGYIYLVPRSDGNGFALLDFRPFSGQGRASYAYAVNALDEETGEWLSLDSGDAFFSLELDSMMGADTGDDATLEETQAFLDRAQAYRDSGVPLLVYDVTYGSSPFETEFTYLDAPPANAFAGKLDTLTALRGCVVSNGGSVTFALPPAGPATPEEALDRLTQSVEAYPDGYVFRIPNYDGEWKIYIGGRMRMGDEGDDYMSVHYLEGEEWVPGKRYSFETNGAYFDDLILTAVVTCHDGSQAEHTICLEGTDEHALVHHETHHNAVQTPVPTTAQTYTHHPETHHSEHHS